MLHLYAMLAVKVELGHVGIEHAYVLSQFKLLARFGNVKIEGRSLIVWAFVCGGIIGLLLGLTEILFS